MTLEEQVTSVYSPNGPFPPGHAIYTPGTSAMDPPKLAFGWKPPEVHQVPVQRVEVVFRAGFPGKAPEIHISLVDNGLWHPHLETLDPGLGTHCIAVVRGGPLEGWDCTDRERKGNLGVMLHNVLADLNQAGQLRILPKPAPRPPGAGGVRGGGGGGTNPNPSSSSSSSSGSSGSGATTTTTGASAARGGGKANGEQQQQQQQARATPTLPPTPLPPLPEKFPKLDTMTTAELQDLLATTPEAQDARENLISAEAPYIKLLDLEQTHVTAARTTSERVLALEVQVRELEGGVGVAEGVAREALDRATRLRQQVEGLTPTLPVVLSRLREEEGKWERESDRLKGALLKEGGVEVQLFVQARTQFQRAKKTREVLERQVKASQQQQPRP